MKKSLFTIIVLALLASCSVKTNEEKARELIEPELKAHLINPESYEFAKLQLDSCYGDDVQRSPQMFLFALKAAKLYNEYKGYVEEVDNAKSAGNFYSSTGSSLFKQQAAKNNADLEKAQRKADDAKQKILQWYKDNKPMFESFEKGKHELTGWAAKLAYRAETAGGIKTMGFLLYFLDKDFKGIVACITEEDLELLDSAAPSDLRYEFADELKEIYGDEIRENN